ncbi:MAG: PAS domain S-box protein [Deltaproteobacteria bacterium]|nr:PAS domain S-box protein [Deltaproteobacteria bacterium]
MREAQALNVAIVGDGLGCKAIMDLILGKRLSQLQMKLIGVAYKNPESVGYRFAKKSGIYVTRDYRDFYNLKDLNMIIELTGHKEVADEISRTKPDHVRVMDHVGARVFWDLFQIEEQKIADLKRAHDDLRNSEQEKKAILDSILEVVLYQDLEHRMLWGNRMACGSVYLTPEEFVGRHCYEAWQQRSEPCPGCPVVKTRETGQTQEAEITTPDGRVWFVRGYPVRDANGDIAGVVEVKLEITDHKRSEEALWESEEKYRSLITNIPDITWRTDINGNTTFISPNIEKVYGYSHEEIYKAGDKLWFGRIHSDDVDKVKKSFEKLFTEGTRLDVEYRIQRKDGKWIWVHDKSTGTLEKNGVKFADGILSDITDRKRAEGKYKILFESSRDAIMMLAPPTWKFTAGNPSTIAMFGAKEEQEFLSKGPWQVSPEYQPDGQLSSLKAHKMIEKAMRTGSNFFYWTHKRISGEEFPATVLLTKVEIEGEELLQATVRDITNRKRAEEAVRQSEARYRSLLENIDLGITLIDSDYNIIMTNTAHGKLFNKPASEFVGKKCFREFQKREAVCSHCPGVQAMASGRPAEFEAEDVRDDGTCFDMNIHAFPTFGRNGTVTGFIEIVEDITEKKKLESQLRQAHKMEALGTMSGGIAHDFNNILSIIVGNTELAMYEVPEWHKARHNLKEVRKACLRAKDVVKQILAFSRETKEERKPVELGPIIKESLKFLRSSIPATIRIDQHISAESDTVLADATQISQVLLNLCTNAAHAMEEKGGTLEVNLKGIELDKDAVSQYLDLAPGSYLRLSVSDTGQGIEPKLIDRIFDPYFTTKEVDEGTGLGLSVCDGIVKNHGGAITVDTEPGKGSTFHVYLPIIEPIEEISEPEAEEPIPTGHECILFIDDNLALMEMGKEMLEHLGYEVVTRTSSIEALELFRVRSDKFDLVITDMTMPNMTGDKLAGELMKIRPDIPVILCTGFSERISKERAKTMGIKAFLMKPVVRREIAETIRKVLDEN